MARSLFQHNISESHGPLPVIGDMSYDSDMVVSFHADFHAGGLPSSSIISLLIQKIPN